MLQRLWKPNILFRMQRKLFRSISSLEALKNYKQYSDIFPRMESSCQHSRLHAVTEKPDPLPNKNRMFFCYSTRRSTSYSNSYYSSLQCNQWTFASNRNINYVLSASTVRPHFQIRHISGQSGEDTLGVWTRVYFWLSESTAVGYAQDLLLFVHNSTGLPWWAAIVLATALLRSVVTLPLAFYQVCSTDRGLRN